MSRPNFAAIKQRISHEQATKLLKLSLTIYEDGSLRCECPTCGSDDPREFSIREANGKWTFRCFSWNEPSGTSVIDMAAHALGLSVVAGAQWLEEHETEEWLEEYSPAEEASNPAVFAPLEKLPKLNPHDDEVKAIGFDADIALVLGIGLASGVMRGHIGCPLYDQEELSRAGIKPVGYAGIPKGTDIWLPKNLRSSS
ncbi:MAG: hypothetical protein Hals2KO_37190 [Halioglobus sp.]